MTSVPRPAGYRFGSFVLDLEWGGLLAADGRELPLRPKSFALLCMLVENAGRVISHDRIMEILWPDLFVTENNITQCIYEIRRALGPEALTTLQTLPRRGYRFTARVTVLPPWPRYAAFPAETGVVKPYSPRGSDAADPR